MLKLINLIVMKKNTDAEEIVVKFNDCINNKQLKALGDLMTEEHQFIVREGNITSSGKLPK